MLVMLGIFWARYLSQAASFMHQQCIFAEGGRQRTRTSHIYAFGAYSCCINWIKYERIGQAGQIETERRHNGDDACNEWMHTRP